jgi:CRP-like cAMP-binding protein
MSLLNVDGPANMAFGESPQRFATALDRLLYLKTILDLADLSPRALSYIAQRSTERTFEIGDHLYEPDRPVESVHFVIDGRVAVEEAGAPLMQVAGRARLGFLAVLAPREVRWDATALEPTHTLELSAEDLHLTLQTDATFMETGIRKLSRRMIQMQGELGKRGLLHRSEPIQTAMPRYPLDPIERLSRLRVGPHANTNVEALFELAESLSERRYQAGDLIWGEGDDAEVGLHVVHGVVRCGEGDQSFRMGAGSIIGELEALAAMGRRYRAVAESQVVALAVSREAFLDIAEANFGLAKGFVSFISGSLLDLQSKLAQASPATSGYPTPAPAANG